MGFEDEAAARRHDEAHTDRTFTTELRALRDQLVKMGTLSEGMLASALRALREHDTALAARTRAEDERVDALEIAIDEACLAILARRQPVASDLRAVAATLKIVTDVERIGDLAAGICTHVEALCAEPALTRYVDINDMALVAQGMVAEALEAFVAADAEAAGHVIERDRTVDAYYIHIQRELLTYMMENARNIGRASRLIAVTKLIERVGDHATNIAEMVVFLARGQDIRHTAPRNGH